jgi:phage-related minor tail protein
MRSHEQALTNALHAEVDGIDPCDCADQIRQRITNAARTGAPWLIAVTATIDAALIIAGLLMLAAEHKRAEHPHTPAIRPLEA